MDGRRTEGSVTARGPHSGRRPVKLQDLKLRQAWYVVVLGGVGASVGARDKALGLWPSVGQSTVIWTGRGRGSPSAQLDLPGCSRFDFFQLRLGGLEPAGRDVSLRAGGGVGVVVGGGVALMLPPVPGVEGRGWRRSPLRGGGG